MRCYYSTTIFCFIYKYLGKYLCYAKNFLLIYLIYIYIMCNINIIYIYIFLSMLHKISISKCQMCLYKMQYWSQCLLCLDSQHQCKDINKDIIAQNCPMTTICAHIHIDTHTHTKIQKKYQYSLTNWNTQKDVLGVLFSQQWNCICFSRLYKN